MAAFSKKFSLISLILTKIANPTSEIVIDAIRNFPKSNDFLEL